MSKEAIKLRSLQKILTEVQFSDRTETPRNKTKKAKVILPFVTSYNPATPNLIKILMKHWHIIQQQPRLAHILNQPTILSYRKEKITQGHFSPGKTSFNHTAIIKKCNKEAQSEGLFSKQNEIYIWSFSPSYTLSPRSRNSTERMKLAFDHLLTAPSFKLRTFQLIIHSKRRSWELVDFI